MGRKRDAQFTLSVKVSEDEKARFAALCANGGLTQSQMLLRAVRGNVPPVHDMPAVAREVLTLAHRLRAALDDGRPVDAAMLHELCVATADLIAVVRERIAR